MLILNNSIADLSVFDLKTSFRDNFYFKIIDNSKIFKEFDHFGCVLRVGLTV